MARAPNLGALYISIHALHEESDPPHTANSHSNPSKFQSTLSMRRATGATSNPWSRRTISIHALHEESDVFPTVRAQLPYHFNPRSP